LALLVYQPLQQPQQLGATSRVDALAAHDLHCELVAGGFHLRTLATGSGRFARRRARRSCSIRRNRGAAMYSSAQVSHATATMTAITA
jgi:hypothetical protein